MELINYLNEKFYTKQALLDVTKVSEPQFIEYQELGTMPHCSYRLSVKVDSESFFGEHHESLEFEFYAKGYASWLGILETLRDKDAVYAHFSNRYKETITTLKEQGHSSTDPKVNLDLDATVKEAWKYFLDGTYGLCSRTGLPEDIAAKGFAIIQINELSSKEKLNHGETDKLTKAVNLLDEVASEFAPHERIKSSRHRLVNEIRRKYQLQG